MSRYRPCYWNENRDRVLSEHGLDIGDPEDFTKWCEMEMRNLLQFLPEVERERFKKELDEGDNDETQFRD